MTRETSRAKAKAVPARRERPIADCRLMMADSLAQRGQSQIRNRRATSHEPRGLRPAHVWQHGLKPILHAADRRTQEPARSDRESALRNPKSAIAEPRATSHERRKQ